MRLVNAKVYQKTHNFSRLLTPGNPLYARCILHHTTALFLDDIGKKGDITTESLFHKRRREVIYQVPTAMRARILASEPGICAGRQEVEYFLQKGPPRFRPGLRKLNVKFFINDGECVRKDQAICEIFGQLRDILKIERTVLNLLGRMCGVATITHRIVKKARAANPHVLICPTRKTLWGLLDKRACALGGGGTHRLGLFDAILIKDNHLDAAERNILSVLRNIFPLRQKVHFVEIEVENPKEAISASREFRKLQEKKLCRVPCFVMLDNVTPRELKKTLQMLNREGLRRAIGVEVSGGITEENVKEYAKTGVDIISMGCLTHSAEMLDLSLCL